MTAIERSLKHDLKCRKILKRLKNSKVVKERVRLEHNSSLIEKCPGVFICSSFIVMIVDNFWGEIK